jgi:ATPases involved in chromosome partitioning
MLVQPIQKASQPAHVVVLASEKGGSGKSTTALHIAVALLKAASASPLSISTAAENFHPLHREPPRLG